MTEQEAIPREEDELFEIFKEEDGTEYKLVPKGPEGKSLGWFTLKQVKLNIIKKMINGIAPMLFSAVATGSEAGGVDHQTGSPRSTQAVNVLTDKIWTRLDRAMKVEKGHLLKDDNMAKLVKSVRNAIVYVCEQDNYYRVWWAYFLTLVWEEMQIFYDNWNPLECEDLGFKKARFKKNGKPVPLEDAKTNPAFKKQLFYWYLSRHLPYLEKSNVTLKPKNIGEK